jgi:RHS repeat-associated protein
MVTLTIGIGRFSGPKLSGSFMRLAVFKELLAVASVLMISNAHAQAVFEEARHAEPLRGATDVRVIDEAAFGENIGLQRGAVEFLQTDIDLPGNDALPVRVQRRLVVENKLGSPDLKVADFGMAGEWAVPYMHGVHMETGWQVAGSSPNSRCTVAAPPPHSPGEIAPRHWWSGNFIYIPEVGDQEVLAVATDNVLPLPSTHSTPWLTKDHWRIACLPNTANGYPGEAFLAISPEGIKYTFNHVVSKSYPAFIKRIGNFGATRSVPRKKVYFLATRVEDRFGNFVQYHYVGDKIERISSSDNRSIRVAGRIGDKVSRIESDAGTWTYEYQGGLVTVTRPDGSTWEYVSAGALHVEPVPSLPYAGGGRPPFCPLAEASSGHFNYSIKHPSGAVASYEFLALRHSRHNIPDSCQVFQQGPQEFVRFLSFPNYNDSLTLVKKTLSGPALATLTTNYSYSGGNALAFEHVCMNPPTSLACPKDTKTIARFSDGRITEYSFGAMFNVNEGQLLSVRDGRVDQHGQAHFARVTSHEYVSNADAALFPFPSLVGRDFHSYHGDTESSGLRPLKQSTITHSASGDHFTKSYLQFDIQARPTRVRRESSRGFSREETIGYSDNLSNWVMGQVSVIRCALAEPADEACDGIGDEIEEVEYDSNAMPWKISSFGRVPEVLTYNTAALVASGQRGTLLTSADGRANVTRFSDWYRGIPQVVEYPGTQDWPSGTTRVAQVDAAGRILKMQDENGFETAYDYDAMGRLTLTDYPDEVLPAANSSSTHRSFSLTAAKYGLPSHWALHEWTGNGYSITRYDSLWRPVVSEVFDSSAQDATRRIVVKRYDQAGRLVFESYPLRTLTNWASINDGWHTSYDDLDRVVEVLQTSELGDLITSTEYLGGLRTRVTLPKHQGADPSLASVTDYQAWDQPTSDYPVRISQPEGVSTSIVRDALGKVLRIHRGGQSDGVSRTYSYDAQHRVCMSVEPETGATVYGYDDDGNLAWSAAGLPAATSCSSSPSVEARSRLVERSYDSRGRIRSLRFPDTRGDQDWSYTKDGLPSRVVTVNVPGATHPENRYEYNKRRLLTTEVQFLPAWYAFSIGYKYNSNGHLEKINYPSGDFVTYSPNALGQPTAAINSDGIVYARDIIYHPDGSLAGLTYGNGIVHSMAQNERQFPRFVKSGAVLDLDYRYDKNGNLEALYDLGRGPSGNIVARYDGLDRLASVSFPKLGNLRTEQSMSFTYDIFDNISTWKRSLVDDRRYCYSASNQLEFIRNRSTSCTAGSATDYFQYDDQGNVEIHNGKAFDFDYGSRLREVIDIERYRYDAYGRRILAMNFQSGAIFSQYSQAGQLLYQQNLRVGKEKQTDHIYLGNTLLAQSERALSGERTQVKYLHTDALGSPVVVTGEAGIETDRTDYAPYGAMLAANTAIGGDGPGYVGHVQDNATGLTYMQQRYYDPMIGRFLSVDPITALSNGDMRHFARYAYAFNNPYSFVDPDGRCNKLINGLVGGLPCEWQERNRNPAHVAADNAVARDAYFVAGPMVAPVVGIGGVASWSVASRVLATERGRTLLCVPLALGFCGEGKLAKPRDAVEELLKRKPPYELVEDFRRRAALDAARRAMSSTRKSMNDGFQGIFRVGGILEGLLLAKMLEEQEQQEE